MFSKYIEGVVDRVEGGIGGVIMGLDGIAVETYVKNGINVDINTIGMEFSFILTQVKKAGDILRLGGVSEFSIKAESITLVMRMLTDEYFLGIAIAADGNYGKCRYLMRMTEPKLRLEL